jgi:uncharacterized membrane protein YfcA
MRSTVLPFALGSFIGAAIGGQIFVSLQQSILQMILGISILVLAWVPRIARFGPERGRFVFVGFLTTFLDMFIAGTWLGKMILEPIPERLFRISFQIILSVLALRLIWIAASGT